MIDGSEERCRDVLGEFRRAAFETAVQMRVEARPRPTRLFPPVAAAEHMHQARRIVFGEQDPKGRQWAEQLIDAMCRGGAERGAGKVGRAQQLNSIKALEERGLFSAAAMVSHAARKR